MINEHTPIPPESEKCYIIWSSVSELFPDLDLPATALDIKEKCRISRVDLGWNDHDDIFQLHFLHEDKFISVIAINTFEEIYEILSSSVQCGHDFMCQCGFYNDDGTNNLLPLLKFDEKSTINIRYAVEQERSLS